jgi:hypothetical protein
MAGQLSKAENNAASANALDYYVGPHCGDIYLTSLDLFSRFTYPKDAMIYLRDDLDYISGGANPNGDIGIWVGTQPGTVTSAMRTRVNERFNLSEEQQSEEAYLPFILAHELGHVIQRDSEFAKYFGEPIDDYIDLEKDYEAYVNSNDELNADYIAVVIVGNSALGKLIDFMPPDQYPIEWRQWAEMHPIPKTIALQAAKA